MIPDIEEILGMVANKACTMDQALQWIGQHIEREITNAALRDHFATTASIGRNSEGILLTKEVCAVMGRVEPPVSEEPDPHRRRLMALQWWCNAEARIRYMKADAMMEARVMDITGEGAFTI